MTRGYFFTRARLQRVLVCTLTVSGAAWRTAMLMTFVVPATATPLPLPVMSGAPAGSVAAGSSYSFQPTAGDPRGRKLSFSVQNKPTWASFSIASGHLYGTPTSAQAGTYANIIISASDGQYSTALPAFTITVTGTAIVAWVPPTANTDGTELTNLAGIRVNYGTSPSNLIHHVQLPASAPPSYTVRALGSGIWYFGITAYNAAGVESPLSAIVSKRIP